MRHFIWLTVLMIVMPCMVFAGEKFDKMTPAEHLKYAKDAISKSATVPAKMHLDAIPMSSKEYGEAKKLYPKIGEVNATIRRKQEESTNKSEAIRLLAARRSFAKQYERNLLDKGFDAYASTQGKNSTVLKLKWVLVSRPMVHQVCNDGELISKLRALGFKKFVLSDGYDSSWTVDL